jgi:polar amino acid transport system substrate-binding protein
MKAETVSSTPIKKPMSMGSIIGIVAGVAVVGCVIAALAINAILNGVPPAATEPSATEPLATEGAATDAAASNLVSQIAKRGNIRIGVRGDSVWPLNVFDGTSHSGFEIDLAEDIVERLFNEPVSIEWVPLTAVDRFPALQSGEIDMLIRTTAHTISREQFGLWTSNYFLDGARLLVIRDLGIENIQDLDGGYIAVISGTTTELILENAARTAGIEHTPVVFENSIDAYTGLVEGQADALISDWSGLLALTQGDPAYQVIGELLSREPFAIGIPPNNSDFRDEVNSVLLEIIADGTWQKIYDRWFTDAPPWTLDEMLAEPPVNR